MYRKELHQTENQQYYLLLRILSILVEWRLMSAITTEKRVLYIGNNNVYSIWARQLLYN